MIGEYTKQNEVVKYPRSEEERNPSPKPKGWEESKHGEGTNSDTGE